ncbi:MAG: penicillin-binding protein 2 [Aquificaceae bacterium]|jgi:penicillin-binding protein 2|uniref:penicillin-binding protein 2 n=1 Tax=Hydrogenobacter sp. Uz 6-8 TaxID=3384828 RepID=UPI0030A26729
MNRRRFIFLFFIGVVAYALVLLRLIYLQLFRGEYYRELSQRNYVRKRVIYPQRGDILDIRGERLAYDTPRYMLLLDHQKLQEEGNLKEVLTSVEELFGVRLDYESIKKRKAIEPVVLTELKTQEEIDRFYNYSYKLPGVFINTIPTRNYPLGEVCAHVVGYVSYPTERHYQKYGDRIGSQSLVGAYGLEKALDEELLGRVGAEEVMVNAVGKVIGNLGYREPEKGISLVTTIDSRIQKIAYEVFRDSGHRAGAVLILDARTGEVLALLSYPSFDPNRINELWSQYNEDRFKPLFNRATQAKYPPASVIKPALGIALLEKGVSEREGVVCRGHFEIGNRKFFCWNRSGHGWENLHRAIRDSCDVYFYHYGYYRLGPREIERTLRSFSYGEDIPFELPLARGFIPTPEWKRSKLKEPWYGGDTVNMSIGQGFMKSTLFEQTLMMMAIANNGVIYRPLLIREKRSAEGKVIWRASRSVYRVVRAKPEHFAVIRESLRDVVRSGTATSAFSTIVEIAGKTGTAQVSAHSVRRKNLPYHLRDHAWFVGFAPYRDPIFVIGVLVEHGGSGGAAAAPIAKRILERIYIEGIHKEI